MKRQPDGDISAALLLQGPLPVLPPGVRYLLDALSDENMDFVELAKVMGRFPSIAARIISVANSAWSSPVAKIDSLEMACARLGFGVVRSMAIALAVSAPFDLHACPAFAPEHFWTSAMLSADGAEWLVPLMTSGQVLEPQTARTAGLLHNLGLLLLADRMPEQTNAALAAAAPGVERAVMARIREQCGIGYDEAGGCLGAAWELPPMLVDAMRHRLGPTDDGSRWLHQSPVGVSVTLVAVVCRGATELPSSCLDGSHAIAPDDLQAVFTRLLNKLEKMRELAGVMMAHGTR